MKKTIVFSLILLTTSIFVACGPAAEDRVVMHQKAKRISDSIGRVIDAALAESAMPQAQAPVSAVDTTAKVPVK